MCPTKRPYMVYHIYAVIPCYIVDLCNGVNPCYVVNTCHSFIHIIVLCCWPLSRRPTVPKATFIEYCFKYQFVEQLHPWLTKQICEGYRCLDWHWWLNWRWWRRQDSGRHRGHRDTETQGHRETLAEGGFRPQVQDHRLSSWQTLLPHVILSLYNLSPGWMKH